MVQGVDGLVNEMKDPEKNYGTDADEVKNLPEKNYGDIDRLWENPRMIMNLIDLLFLLDDPDKKQIPS